MSAPVLYSSHSIPFVPIDPARQIPPATPLDLVFFLKTAAIELAADEELGGGAVVTEVQVLSTPDATWLELVLSTGQRFEVRVSPFGSR